jgi:long-chain acyl-CoA synthetase
MMVDALGTKAAREHDTSSLRMCFCGGSPAGDSTLPEFESVFEVDQFLNYYGQSEAAGLIVAGTPDKPRSEGGSADPSAPSGLWSSTRTPATGSGPARTGNCGSTATA